MPTDLDKLEKAANTLNPAYWTGYVVPGQWEAFCEVTESIGAVIQEIRLLRELDELRTKPLSWESLDAEAERRLERIAEIRRELSDAK